MKYEKKLGIKNGSPFTMLSREVHAKGLSPLPIVAGEKRPCISRWNEYCSEQPSVGELVEWAKQFPDAGLGIALGTRIGEKSELHLVALDIDQDDLVRPVRAELFSYRSNAASKEVMKRGQKGLTIFAVTEGVLPGRKLSNRKGMAVELLSRGQQTVLPPTIHPNGEPYIWKEERSLLDVDLAELPRIDERLLGQIEKLIREDDEPARGCDAPNDNQGQSDSIVYLGGGRFENVEMVYPGNVNDTQLKMAAKAAYWNFQNGRFTGEGRKEAVQGMVDEAYAAHERSGVSESWDREKQWDEAASQYDRAVEKWSAEWGIVEAILPEERATAQPSDPAPEGPEELWAKCRDLATDPNILDRFTEDYGRSGVVGEDRNGKLLYLALTSRLLDHPVSIAVKGPSSGGKSFITDRVLAFFPPGSYYGFTAMSERALVYSKKSYVHRFIVLYEATGMSGEVGSYLIRSLLSEGKLRYETVEKTKNGFESRVIEKEGPTGLIVTTTDVKLHPENETRMFSLTVKDTAAQTKSILLALARESSDSVDYRNWHALQSWLATQDCRVVIPFAKGIALAIPPVATRLRRDFRAILTLIEAHALLHQAKRDRDEDEQIVATQDDYAIVRELVEDILSEGLERTARPEIRETVKSVDDIRLDIPCDKVTVAQVATKLGIDRSTAWRRVRVALERGYLINEQTGKGRPFLLSRGDPLPEEVEILPDPETLSGCTVARETEGIAV